MNDVNKTSTTAPAVGSNALLATGVDLSDVDEDGAVAGYVIETLYQPLKSAVIRQGEKFMRVLSDADATDAEVRIPIEALPVISDLKDKAFTLYRHRDPETGKLDDHYTFVNEDRSGSRRGFVAGSILDAIEQSNLEG